MYLNKLLERQKNNNKIAIKSGDRSILYCDWYNKSKQVSEDINFIIHNRSNNVAIFLPNSIDYAIAYFSILFSKKTIIPIGVNTGQDEVKSTLEYTEVDLIITKSEYKDLLFNILLDYSYSITIFFIDNNNSVNLNEHKRYVKKTINYNDVAIMLHTSGTTSLPKRVMLTHDNLINNIKSNIISLKLDENDVVLVCMPMHFGYCNTAQFLTHLYLGASMVILDGIFTPLKFFKTVQEENITNFTGVPTMLLLLLDYKDYKRYDYSSLRYICFGGGPMPIDKLKKLIFKYDSIGFIQTYGQTEASPRVTALMPVDSLNKIGSVGKAIPNVLIKIVDESGAELKNNENGEIIVSGKNVMKGYFKNESITDETIINGWLHTGDLGYIDDDGYLYITGRIKNIIISGGLNIYPEEVEEILLGYPGIKDVCVIGEEHDLLIEAPVAKVVGSDFKINSKDIRDYCLKRLAIHKIPIRFDFINELNKTYNGKIKRY